ncbi:hypothetical protein D3C81_1619260 [compost metagenome]
MKLPGQLLKLQFIAELTIYVLNDVKDCVPFVSLLQLGQINSRPPAQPAYIAAQPEIIAKLPQVSVLLLMLIHHPGGFAIAFGHQPA